MTPGHLPLIPFPRGWDKQGRWGSGRKDSSPQPSGFFHVRHVTSATHSARSKEGDALQLSPEKELEPDHDVSQAAHRTFPLLMLKCVRAIIQALTFVFCAFLIATDLWLLVRVVPACHMWEGTGSRKNVCGIIILKDTREGMFALYSGFLLQHWMVCDYSSRVKWWVLKHCLPSLEQGLAIHTEERTLDNWVGKWHSMRDLSKR